MLILNEVIYLSIIKKCILPNTQTHTQQKTVRRFDDHTPPKAIYRQQKQRTKKITYCCTFYNNIYIYRPTINDNKIIIN